MPELPEVETLRRQHFNDLRVFGWMKIVKNLKLKIKNLGVEPFGDVFKIIKSAKFSSI